MPRKIDDVNKKCLTIVFATTKKTCNHFEISFDGLLVCLELAIEYAKIEFKNALKKSNVKRIFYFDSLRKLAVLPRGVYK